ncbi:MAG: hypothetical protein SGPRY_005717 [Prymnesium sp.]
MGGERGLPIPCYPELELETSPEPEGEDVEENEHSTRVIDEYQASGGAGGVAAASRLLGYAGQAGEEETEGGERRKQDGDAGLKESQDALARDLKQLDPEVDDFSNFTARIARAPAQCLRYVFEDAARPLWASRARRAPPEIPRCPQCGGNRHTAGVLEFAFHSLALSLTLRWTPYPLVMTKPSLQAMSASWSKFMGLRPDRN